MNYQKKAPKTHVQYKIPTFLSTKYSLSSRNLVKISRVVAIFSCILWSPSLSFPGAFGVVEVGCLYKLKYSFYAHFMQLLMGVSYNTYVSFLQLPITIFFLKVIFNSLLKNLFNIYIIYTDISNIYFIKFICTSSSYVHNCES